LKLGDKLKPAHYRGIAEKGVKVLCFVTKEKSNASWPIKNKPQKGMGYLFSDLLGGKNG